MLASCQHPPPKRQVFAQCELDAAAARHSDVGAAENADYDMKCMEAHGYELDAPANNCGQLVAPAETRRCYSAFR